MKPSALALTLFALAATIPSSPSVAEDCTTITDGMTVLVGSGQVRDLCIAPQNGRVQEVEAGPSADWKVGVGAWRDRIIVLHGSADHVAPLDVLLYTDRDKRFELHLGDSSASESPAQKPPAPQTIK